MLRTAIVLLLVGCSGGAAPSPPAPAPATQVAPRPADPAPASPTPAPRTSCEALERAVAVAVDAGAACTSDDECALRRVNTCGLDGLDCYSVHYNPALGTAAVDQALKALAAACPALRRCRCAEPSESACVAGRCQRP